MTSQLVTRTFAPTSLIESLCRTTHDRESEKAHTRIFTYIRFSIPYMVWQCPNQILHASTKQTLKRNVSSNAKYMSVRPLTVASTSAEMMGNKRR